MNTSINKLSEEQIARNKEEFLELLRSIDREGADIERLIAKLESSDFFTAPASAKYHNACVGGLVDHSLNVYYNLMHLVKYKQLPDISTESILIVSLLHDLDKMNKYVIANKNVKVYSENGSKYDDGGRYDWQSVKSYASRDASERFIYGSHEMNSEYMVRTFIPLTLEESTAILHHMGGMAWDSAKDDISSVYNRYPLACLLYMADMMSTYVDEGCR